MLKTRSARLENPQCGPITALGEALWGLWGVGGPLPPLVCPRCSLCPPSSCPCPPSLVRPSGLCMSMCMLVLPFGMVPPGCAGRGWGHRPRFLPFWLHTRSLGRHGISLRENTDGNADPFRQKENTKTKIKPKKWRDPAQIVLKVGFILSWQCTSEATMSTTNVDTLPIDLGRVGRFRIIPSNFNSQGAMACAPSSMHPARRYQRVVLILNHAAP